MSWNPFGNPRPPLPGPEMHPGEKASRTPPKRQTLWLALLLACVAAWLPLTYFRMAKYRDDARTAAADLARVKLALADIHEYRASPNRASPVSMETPQLTGKLRDAAAAAGLPDAPGSEAGDPRRLATTDFTELPVYLRFEPLTLRQLVTFLHTLAQLDPASRARSIELSVPPPPPQQQPSGAPGEERWSADVEVDWLTHSPQKR